MPSKTLTTSYRIATRLPFSVSFLLSEYFHGIPLTDEDGRRYPTLSIKQQIISTTKQVENFLFIKIMPQTITGEVHDFVEEEWRNWASVKANFTINEIIKVEGYIGIQNILDLNVQNWTARGRSLAFVPGTTVLGNIVLSAGGNMILMRAGVRIIPNFWHITYKTGFDVLPDDIQKIIGKLVAIEVLSIVGDIHLRVGITNESLSIDGLSQSYGTTKSGTTSTYGARIKQYADDLNMREIAQVKDAYRGITFEVI